MPGPANRGHQSCAAACARRTSGGGRAAADTGPFANSGPGEAGPGTGRCHADRASTGGRCQLYLERVERRGSRHALSTARRASAGDRADSAAAARAVAQCAPWPAGGSPAHRERRAARCPGAASIAARGNRMELRATRLPGAGDVSWDRCLRWRIRSCVGSGCAGRRHGDDVAQHRSDLRPKPLAAESGTGAGTAFRDARDGARIRCRATAHQR